MTLFTTSSLFVSLVHVLLTQHVWCQGRTLVMLGGGMDDFNAVWGRIVDLAGGPEAKIGVISAASATPEESAEFYTELFLMHGASEAVWIPIHEGNTDANSDPEVVDSIREMTGFFFSGGSQSRVINSFYNEGEEGREDSPALEAIREMYEGGVVVSGSSAGTACQPSPPMIAGGYSWEGLVYGSYDVNDDDIPAYAIEYDQEGGLKMIQDFIMDSHFSERGREGRLARLLADTVDGPIGTHYAIGIDEDTGFLITDADTPQAVGEVLSPVSGYGGVFIMDISNSHMPNGRQQCWHLANINTLYLTEGDEVNLDTAGDFQVRFADWKSDLVGNENHESAETSDDIFYGNGGDNDVRANYPHVTCRLVDSGLERVTSGVTVEDDPRYEVNFEQLPSTEAYAGTSPTTGKFLISYRGLMVEMKPVEGQEDNENCIS